MNEILKEVQDVQGTQEQAQANVQANVQANEVMNVSNIVAKLMKANKNHFLVNREITAIQSEQRTAKSGKMYTNVWLTLNDGIKRISVNEDGEVITSLLGTFQTPANGILLPLRKHTFYGRFATAIEEYLNANAADIYLCGVNIQIFGQFVAADDITSGNPFVRNSVPYFTEERETDTYIYHIVGIETPKDEILLAEYRDLLHEIRNEAKAKVLAAREAKAKQLNVFTSVSEDSDVPF